MPRMQDIIARQAPMTTRAASCSGGRAGAATNTTGQALYTGAWSYDGTATYGSGGRLTYNGAGHYNDGSQYYTP